MRGSSLLDDSPGADSAGEISGNAGLCEVLAKQEAPDESTNARKDHRNNDPYADDSGAKRARIPSA